MIECDGKVFGSCICSITNQLYSYRVILEAYGNPPPVMLTISLCEAFEVKGTGLQVSPIYIIQIATQHEQIIKREQRKRG